MKFTLTLTETAAILGVNEKSLRNHLHDSVIEMGEQSIRVLRLGRRILVPIAELERVLGKAVAS